MQPKASKHEMSLIGDDLPNENVPLSMRKLTVDEALETLHPPLRYHSGDLGLNDGEEPWVYFEDSKGRRYLTHSVEFLLKHIDLFAEGRDRDSLLAGAAVHYGFHNTYALMGRDTSASTNPLATTAETTQVSSTRRP